MADDGWGETLEGWLLQPNGQQVCEAAGVAAKTDGVFWTAAPIQDEAGWTALYRDDRYKRELLCDDGETTRTVEIYEPECLMAVGAMTDMPKKPENGLWIQGEKYVIVQFSEYSASGSDLMIPVVRAQSKESKKAAVIAMSPRSIIVMLLGEGQKPGNATQAAVAFAEYLQTEDC